MKYFSINTVKTAYFSNSKTTSNRFWGLLSILSAVNATVVPTVSYSFQSNQVSNILNKLFTLKEDKSITSKGQYRSIMLSKNWTTYVSEILTPITPNIYSVLIWYFRLECFDDNLSETDLLTKFLGNTHISINDAKKVFSFDKIEIEFTDKKYSESDLRIALGKHNENITAENNTVVAEPGDFTRGPFLQPLYASQDIMKCLILSTFSLSEYYFDSTPQITSNNSRECLYGPIESGIGKPGMPAFLEGVILSTKQYEENLESLSHSFKSSANKLYIGDCAIGIDKTVAHDLIDKPNRKKDANLDISWQFNGKIYCVYRELNIDVFTSFISEYNRAYKGRFEIVVEKNDKGLPIYTLYHLIGQGNETIQTIYYGSPGTGKSFKVKNKLSEVPEDNIFRITFHPDTDYSSFVGSYKPLKDEDGNITYDYEPQAFTCAYIRAWQNHSESVYLVIEEINRGNCAQIFGDLFQLLDRNNGVSEYPVNADAALAKYLKNELTGDAAEGIANNKLKLPANLNIIATMNTSDQSLFPMDSAFKRRWDWVYFPTTPPKTKEEGGKIEDKIINVGDSEYKWTKFLGAINERIKSVTHSDDKQIGFWFVKTPEGSNEISVSTFVSKVIFYLWNDVFKEIGPKKENPFTVNINDKDQVMTFSSFFEINGDGAVVENIGVLHTFMKNLKLTPTMKNQDDDAPKTDDEKKETAQE